jgi:hypothetical protein
MRRRRTSQEIMNRERIQWIFTLLTIHKLAFPMRVVRAHNDWYSIVIPIVRESSLRICVPRDLSPCVLCRMCMDHDGILYEYPFRGEDVCESLGQLFHQVYKCFFYYRCVSAIPACVRTRDVIRLRRVRIENNTLYRMAWESLSTQDMAFVRNELSFPI